MQSFLRESSASDSNPGFLIKLNMQMHKYIPHTLVLVTKQQF